VLYRAGTQGQSHLQKIRRHDDLNPEAAGYSPLMKILPRLAKPLI